MAPINFYYILDSETFFSGGYNPSTAYRLKLAKSMTADNLSGKKLDFSAVALILGGSGLNRRNNGILTYTLYLPRAINIQGEGPIPNQVISRLNYAFAFRDAERNSKVGGMAYTPIFSGVSVSDHLSLDGNPKFCFEISLAKSGGSNANTIIDIASGILRDPTVKAGLVAALPILGIASAVFEVVRITFFGSGQAKTIWKTTKVQFSGVSGTGIPLKIGRYAFISTKLGPAKVVESYRYRDGVFMDTSNENEVVQNANQFYLDIYAY